MSAASDQPLLEVRDLTVSFDTEDGAIDWYRRDELAEDENGRLYLEDEVDGERTTLLALLLGFAAAAVAGSKATTFTAADVACPSHSRSALG